ncbi:hypothetical protein TWF506_004039 [Arthrobotrys conoides]|uniref:SprT-like domain-containing protein n=1 Tax=Arthrobotrys conoides TaxID=74498 RepID=A0AAN8N1D4_9PEZI
MVSFARLELGPNYDPKRRPMRYTIEEFPVTSADYEPVLTAWRTALSISRSQRFRQVLLILAARLQSFVPLRILETQVDGFILGLNQDYQMGLENYTVVVDARLQRSVLRNNERPHYKIHLNKQYVRSIMAVVGDPESRLRCLLATTIIHELAHCFVTYTGYKSGEITPKAINHISFTGKRARGVGESGRYLEGLMWGGTLEWQAPVPGQFIGDLFVLDDNSNARLVLRSQVIEIGSYNRFDLPLEIPRLQLEPPPFALTYLNCMGFYGLNFFETGPNPLPEELLQARLMAVKDSIAESSQSEDDEEVV